MKKVDPKVFEFDRQETEGEYLVTKTNHSRLMRHDMKGGNVLEHTITKQRICGWCRESIEGMSTDEIIDHLESHGEPRI